LAISQQLLLFCSFAAFLTVAVLSLFGQKGGRKSHLIKFFYDRLEMFYALGYKSLLNVLRHREKHEEKEIVSVSCHRDVYFITVLIISCLSEVENCLREFILPN